MLANQWGWFDMVVIYVSSPAWLMAIVLTLFSDFSTHTPYL